MLQIKKISEDLLGRKLRTADGVSVERISKIEKKLGLKLPPELREFYRLVGNVKIFTTSFQRFAKLNQLMVRDSILLFLEENQEVCYWGINIKKKDKVVYQVIFGKTCDVYSEKISLLKFLLIILYYQCAQGGYKYCAIKGMKSKFISEIGNVKLLGVKVVEHNGLNIYFKSGKLVWYFANEKGAIEDFVFTSTLNKKLLKEQIMEFGFIEN